MNHSIEAIAFIRSPFQEKFGTPRQPGLTPAVTATIEFVPQYCPEEALRAIEGFSHLWLLFIFHQAVAKGWKSTVRPPRLGGNRRVGVYASRSPFRPNHIGMSPARLIDVHKNNGQFSLTVTGADLIDGTPIIDIKPYITYGDSIADAESGYATGAPSRREVVFNDEVAEQLQQLPDAEALQAQLTEVLSLDPRPAYKSEEADHNSYGILFADYNVKWMVEQGRVVVTEIELEKS